jgi:hypothetical protein
MLANGATLGYKSTGVGTTYTNLTGLKEIPELGGDPEKVEVTTLADNAKQYEYGVTDYGDLAFKFKYENSSASSPYRVLRELAKNKTKTDFQLILKDGTKFSWSAIPNVKLGGGGVNGAIDFTLGMALQSDITPTDPA